MIGNLFSAISIALMSSVLAIGQAKIDSPLNNYDITSIEKSYSPYYDDYLTGLLFYNTSFDQNITSSNSWTYSNNHYYRTYAYDFHAQTWGTGSPSIARDMLSHDPLIPYEYTDGYATGDDYSYDFILAFNLDTTTNTCYYMALLHNTNFVFGENTYQIEKFAMIWKFDNSSYSGYYYPSSYSFNFSNVSNLELWLDTRIDSNSYLDGGTYTKNNNTYQMLFSGYFTGVSTLYASSFHMEWLLPSIDDGNTAYQDGYKTGYANGNSTGYSNGYTDGYAQGISTAQTGTFTNLFSSLADTPLRFIYGLFNFDLFGTSVLVIVLTLLTGIIVFGIVKKFWK